MSLLNKCTFNFMLLTSVCSADGKGKAKKGTKKHVIYIYCVCTKLTKFYESTTIFFLLTEWESEREREWAENKRNGWIEIAQKVIKKSVSVSCKWNSKLHNDHYVHHKGPICWDKMPWKPILKETNRTHTTKTNCNSGGVYGVECFSCEFNNWIRVPYNAGI